MSAPSGLWNTVQSRSSANGSMSKAAICSHICSGILCVVIVPNHQRCPNLMYSMNYIVNFELIIAGMKPITYIDSMEQSKVYECGVGQAFAFTK